MDTPNQPFAKVSERVTALMPSSWPPHSTVQWQCRQSPVMKVTVENIIPSLLNHYLKAHSAGFVNCWYKRPLPGAHWESHTKQWIRATKQSLLVVSRLEHESHAAWLTGKAHDYLQKKEEMLEYGSKINRWLPPREWRSVNNVVFMLITLGICEVWGFCVQGVFHTARGVERRVE